jgi:hypothetical protein
MFLNRTDTVLVVAPKEEFRRSIAFALEAEGFGVEAHELLTSALASPLADSGDCTVIDDHAIKAVPGGWKTLNRFRQPIVLLSNQVEPAELPPHAIVLLKPLLGRSLTDTVIAVIAERRADAEQLLRTTT